MLTGEEAMEIRVLMRQGMSIGSIARTLGMFEEHGQESMCVRQDSLAMGRARPKGASWTSSRAIWRCMPIRPGARSLFELQSSGPSSAS